MSPIPCEVLPVNDLDPNRKVQKGLFVGLINTEAGDTYAVVMHDDQGMFLQQYHPSRVRLTPETKNAP